MHERAEEIKEIKQVVRSYWYVFCTVVNVGQGHVQKRDRCLFDHSKSHRIIQKHDWLSAQWRVGP